MSIAKLAGSQTRPGPALLYGRAASAFSQGACRLLAGVLAVIAGGSTATAISPPVEQGSAECTRPVYAIDIMVCSDPALLAQDEKVYAMANALGSVVAIGAPPFLEAQGDWFRRRSLCAFQKNARACTSAAYRERLAILMALSSGAVPTTFSCSAKTLSPLRGAYLASGALILSAGEGIVGVAVAPSTGSGWTPYVRLSGTNAAPVAVSRGSVTARCKAQRKQQKAPL